jgi:hypothetical protein
MKYPLPHFLEAAVWPWEYVKQFLLAMSYGGQLYLGLSVAVEICNQLDPADGFHLLCHQVPGYFIGSFPGLGKFSDLVYGLHNLFWVIR